MRLAAAAALALLLAPGVAFANGRPPLTNGMHFGPGDDHSIYVASTFGLLISHDDGCTFNWVCEQAIGYGGTFDPKYAIAADGAIYAATFDGLRISRDGGCSFELTQFRAAQRNGSDTRGLSHDLWTDALDIGPTGQVWAGTAEGGAPNNVYMSSDNGHTFARMNLGSARIWWKSVKVAPSDSTRVYVSGYQVAGGGSDGGPQAHLVRTDDDGATWQASALAGVTYGPTPIVIVAAVSPTNRDTVFVTSLGAGKGVGDRLYRSTDGGATLDEVLVTADAIRDVVVVDATKVLVATIADGTYESLDGGASFIPHDRHFMPPTSSGSETPKLACLAQRSDGMLFGCGANWVPDYKAVATSADGDSWSKVFRFVNLAGPLSCPAGTPEHDACGPLWPSIQQQFESTGPTCGSDVGLADAPGVDGKLKPMSTPAATGGGCCEAGGAGAPGAAMFGLGLGVLVLRRRGRGG